VIKKQNSLNLRIKGILALLMNLKKEVVNFIVLFRNILDTRKSHKFDEQEKQELNATDENDDECYLCEGMRVYKFF